MTTDANFFLRAVSSGWEVSGVSECHISNKNQDLYHQTPCWERFCDKCKKGNLYKKLYICDKVKCIHSCNTILIVVLYNLSVLPNFFNGTQRGFFPMKTDTSSTLHAKLYLGISELLLFRYTYKHGN